MEEKPIVHTTHAGSCALILPRESGVVYQHQTGGMMCGQALFEGVLLPISRPKVIDEDRSFIDLMDELRKYDYPADNEYTELEWDSREELWSKIEERLSFNFRLLDTEEIPEDYPKRGAWEWIEILGEDTRDDGRTRMPVDEWAEVLQGEKAVLLYPNCD